MTEEKEKSFQDIRFRFDDLSEQVRRLHDEWREAHARSDIDRETELVRRETDLFSQFDEVVKEFAGWLKQSRAA